MSENSSKVIMNGAIASVIAGLIMLSVPAIRAFLHDVLSWPWNAINASYSLVGWAWLPILFLALVGLVQIYLATRTVPEEHVFKSYTEDLIHGAKWRWRWHNNQVSDPCCFCPQCDAALVYDDISHRNFFEAPPKTDFICENCNYKIISSIQGGNKDYAVGVIVREVGRRVRTNNYPSDRS